MIGGGLASSLPCSLDVGVGATGSPPSSDGGRKSGDDAYGGCAAADADGHDGGRRTEVRLEDGRQIAIRHVNN